MKQLAIPWELGGENGDTYTKPHVEIFSFNIDRAFAVDWSDYNTSSTFVSVRTKVDYGGAGSVSKKNLHKISSQ